MKKINSHWQVCFPTSVIFSCLPFCDIKSNEAREWGSVLCLAPLSIRRCYVPHFTTAPLIECAEWILLLLGDRVTAKSMQNQAWWSLATLGRFTLSLGKERWKVRGSTFDLWKLPCVSKVVKYLKASFLKECGSLRTLLSISISLHPIRSS